MVTTIANEDGHVRVAPALHRLVKIEAATRGVSVKELVEQAIRKELIIHQE